MKRPITRAGFGLAAVILILAGCSPKAASPTAVPTVAVPAANQTPAPTAVPPAACSVASSAIPAAGAEELAAVASIPPVSADDLVRGPSDAAVTVLIYSDYQ